jgi:hypothetical protein
MSMKAIDFKGTNTDFNPPTDMPHDCAVMPAFTGTMYDDNPVPVVVSCHEMSDIELLRVIETKRVWLTTVGAGRAPVLLTVENPLEEGWAK